MKQFLTIAFVALLSASNAFAQTRVEDFRQPYAIGEKLQTENFTGTVWLSKVIGNDSLNLPAFNVTFAPACINSWHYHTGGQVLVATAGTGYYQEQGKPARRLHAGDIVEIAPNTVHWHGAAPESWFAHVAVACNPKENKTVWLAPVGDAAYRKAVAESESLYLAAQKTLSARQRAIVELGIYTGKGDLQGVRQAIVQAFEAAMTQNEVKEVLIHAYAYCGFPRSLRAIQTLMDVVDERKAAGIDDPVGREATAMKTKGDKYRRGLATLSQLTGTPTNASKAPYAEFAPTIDRFLKEHLFADIFDRDLLTYTERELATVSILAALGGVEPMVQGHLSICLHLGLTPAQLSALLDIVEHKLGARSAEPLRNIYDKLINK